ncbi:hypothetical protein HK405_014314, partial [Cladochytrium tenue]
MPTSWPAARAPRRLNLTVPPPEAGAENALPAAKAVTAAPQRKPDHKAIGSTSQLGLAARAIVGAARVRRREGLRRRTQPGATSVLLDTGSVAAEDPHPVAATPGGHVRFLTPHRNGHAEPRTPVAPALAPPERFRRLVALHLNPVQGGKRPNPDVTDVRDQAHTAGSNQRERKWSGGNTCSCNSYRGVGGKSGQFWSFASGAKWSNRYP